MADFVEFGFCFFEIFAVDFEFDVFSDTGGFHAIHAHSMNGFFDGFSLRIQHRGF